MKTAVLAQAIVADNSQKIDINTASVQELMQLPGVGEGRSLAIIRNRPFSSPEELVQKNIMPPQLYEVVKDKIKVQ